MKRSFTKQIEPDSIIKTSILIPGRYYLLFKYVSDQLGGIPNFLNIALDKFEPVLEKKLRIAKKTTPKRQKKGQYLQKFSIEPGTEDWLEVRILAMHFGVTMCFLFTLLVKLYLKYWMGRYMPSLWMALGVDMSQQTPRTTPRTKTMSVQIILYTGNYYGRTFDYG